jgi:HlyD family secretion protein
MQIDANVAEADIGNIEIGQEVEFTVDAFPSRVFHGKVIQIRNSPITVWNVVSYDTVIEVQNNDLKLKPGMTANASIIIKRSENALKVPNAAFRFRPADAKPETPSAKPRIADAPKSGRTVYLLREGEESPTPASVKVGISDGISTEALEGVAEGDVVITGNAAREDVDALGVSNPLGGMPSRRF